ncbi:MAG: MerC domain-containing protein [Pseudomonadota bacterium]
MISLTKNSFLLDKCAISVSSICAIHCLTLPIILSVFPALGSSLFGQEEFHALLIWLIIPLSVIALTIGCKLHKNWFVACLGFLGLCILIFTALLGHDVLGENAERISTLIGSAIIALGHLINYTLCRRDQCQHKTAI